MKCKTHPFMSVVGLFLIFLALSSCSPQTASLSGRDSEETGADAITESRLRAHIAFLADDLFLGRYPGEWGMYTTSRYMAAQLELLGIEPGGEDGTYYQKVFLKNFTFSDDSKFKFSSKTDSLALSLGDDILFWQNYIGQDTLKVPLVFAGYGIEAPDVGWNDFKDFDATGKLLVVLHGAPNNDQFDEKVGRIYGSDLHKWIQARKKGAAGVLIVHDSEKSTPWEELGSYYARRNNKLSENEHKPGPLVAPYDWHTGSPELRGNIKPEAWAKILGLSETDESDLVQRAAQPDFSPVTLTVNTDFNLKIEIKQFECRNVIGLIRGQIEDEYVIVSAHLDHLGVGKPIDGDGIYNGAVDNGTGCAGVIEIGRAFQNLPKKPNRSIILIATTAEEHGLLGARAYARNPAFPPGKTLAVINMDEMVDLKKRPEVFIGAGEISTLGELGKEIASDMGLDVNEAQIAGAERGLYNSDHGGFAEAGIPGILLLDDTKPLMETDEYMVKMHKDWQKRGHSPKDEYSDDWEMGNITQLIRMAFRYAYRLTITDAWPEWIEELPFYYHPALPYQQIRRDSLN